MVTVRRCKHCKRPVRKMQGELGYCKKCIRLAQQEQGDEAVRMKKKSVKLPMTTAMEPCKPHGEVGCLRCWTKIILGR